MACHTHSDRSSTTTSIIYCFFNLYVETNLATPHGSSSTHNVCQSMQTFLKMHTLRLCASISLYQFLWVDKARWIQNNLSQF
jgi:hypothetical protein